jgi:hypothetical protein
MDLYINDNGEFWDGKPIELNGLKYISPNAELLAQVGYHLYVPPQPTEQELLEQAKFDKENEIDAYDASLEKFIIGGQEMWLGHKLRQQLKTSVEAYVTMGAETVTKWFNGNEFTFPTNMWLQMLAMLEVYAAEVLNTTERHKAAINAMDNIKDVEDYDITQGYPEKLTFPLENLS